ncbi:MULTISPECIES: Na+/H+ antiporter subunit E [unclassified Lysobacter]|uniref:Na+/H+ antiporter subunit E n=1 Tax=unclassified Lysobacter TaxID=2635362 RepID=UPI0020B44D8C|nr:Na+/H+ antiporter subunit E [Lysobacter sp. MMG2]
MGAPSPAGGKFARGRYAWTALMRGAGFLALWIVLMPSAKPADVAFGLVASVLATWTSLQLLRPEAGHLKFGALLALGPHFLWQSVLAGIDVARRAFDPRLPLAPGIVECPVAFPRGVTRNTFAAITSLLPGSVPCGETQDTLVYHCLDRDLPNTEQLKREEQLFARALIPAREDDHD